MSKLSLLLVSIVIFAVSAQTTFAADANCKPLFGGGETNQQVCNGEKTIAPAAPTGQQRTPTVKPKTSPTPTKSPRKQTGATTKGGLPVVSPKPQKTTPSTGPEVLGMIALVPAAAVGYYLRKHS